jgi:phosphoribosylformylglycinamidine cyclo-ligase
VNEGGATYLDAGVSIEANEEAVGLIAKRVASAGATRPEVIGTIGGFAGAFSGAFAALQDPVLVSATDGVGTKLSIAQTLRRHDTVGFDLVAMVVDDIVCAGAEPLFLLDYIACGRNEPARTADIVEGIARACAFAGAALLGGETAEHPGMMDEDEYDLAAFGVGVVDRSAMLGPERVVAGDVVVGCASSGLHSNGYSLVRRLILDKDLSLADAAPGGASGRTLGDELLEPTRVYAPAVLAAARTGAVHAAAHVTGGGLAANLARALPDGLGARIDATAWQRPPIFGFLQDIGGIATDEMRRVFNDGIGMCVVAARERAPEVLDVLKQHGETATVIGEVVAGSGVSLAG